MEPVAAKSCQSGLEKEGAEWPLLLLAGRDALRPCVPQARPREQPFQVLPKLAWSRRNGLGRGGLRRPFASALPEAALEPDGQSGFKLLLGEAANAGTARTIAVVLDDGGNPWAQLPRQSRSEQGFHIGLAVVLPQ